MKLIVGLGNPGKKYEKTRHNLGFMALEHFLKDFALSKATSWEDSSKFKSDIAQLEWQPKHGYLEKIILVKPKTFMNNSGLAVSILVNFYKIPTADIWIVHDDIDLPIGNLKIRFGGASAGHRGVESIIENLGTDKFWRFRMGIGEKKELNDSRIKVKDVNDFVLGIFSGAEKSRVKDVMKRTVKALQTSLEESLDSAMNRFNTK
jgi:PTH1 family peptidyl-tRNA hydrolase